MNQNFFKLPPNLPVPIDDGEGDCLLGKSLPHVILIATSGKQINLAKIKGKTVFYCYPMTGQSGVKLPKGWDLIPGARGCTPQSCSFRDHYQELQALDAQVYGISTQETSAQLEAQQRLHLPFELLSDLDLKLAKALQLPTFKVENKQLLKRLTFITQAGTITRACHQLSRIKRNKKEKQQ